MISFALGQCDFLSVLICCSNTETISGELRKQWINETFGCNPKLEVLVFNYNESDLANTSQASEEVSKAWSVIFKKLFPEYSTVVTSEPYGDYIAGFMNVKHIPFDISRRHIPVSATTIRTNLFENYRFLPDSVKPFYAIKVVVAGTESTGKTTLTQQLAAHFNCSYVLETAREIIPFSNNFQYSDLNTVVVAHASQISKAVLLDCPLVIIDTDIYTTMSYAQFRFTKALTPNSNLLAVNKAHLYLYLNNDVAYVQDGTRLSEDDRNRLDLSHRRILNERAIAIQEIKGSWQQRFEMAIKYINQLLLAKTN